MYALGTAVSECSRDVLRNIERTVKTTIRRRNVERSQYEYEQQERDLLDHRGLSAPEPDPAPAGENTGQVRATAPDLPDEASPGAVQLDASVGNSASAPVGGGANRREADAADHAGVAETEPGSEQGAVSDGVGAAHEQPESTGRGTGDERADLQLSFFDTEALRVLAEAWEGDIDSLRSEVLQGVVRFIALYDHEYDPVRLIRQLKRTSPVTIYRSGQAMSGPNYQKYMHQILKAYNGSSRTKSLPIKQ